MTNAAVQSMSDDPLEGTPYRTIGLLGKGGMGEVFEAEHVALGVRVVIKLLFRTNWARLDLKERMRVEAQTGARIRHENLVQVTDIGETLDGRAFVVMERLYGRSLADEVKARGPIPIAEAVDITRQILAGLSKAHEAGVVHRDVKPDNIFLADEREGGRRVKVLDFGIAKIIDAAADPRTPAPLAVPTAEGIVVGTPRWCSPEQLSGEKNIDARSDVYSTALVLWTLLTGQEPYRGRKGLLELSQAHASEPLAPPSSVVAQVMPPALERALAKALAKRREDRFATAAAFREELGRYDEPVVSAAPAGQRAVRVWASTEEIDPEMATELRRTVGSTKRPTGTLEMAPVVSSRNAVPPNEQGAPRSARASSVAVVARTLELPDSGPTLASAGARAVQAADAGVVSGGSGASEGKGGTLDLAVTLPPRAVLPWEGARPAARAPAWLAVLLCGILCAIVMGLWVMLRGS